MRGAIGAACLSSEQARWRARPRWSPGAAGGWSRPPSTARRLRQRGLRPRRRHASPRAGLAPHARVHGPGRGSLDPALQAPVLDLVGSGLEHVHGPCCFGAHGSAARSRPRRVCAGRVSGGSGMSWLCFLALSGPSQQQWHYLKAVQFGSGTPVPAVSAGHSPSRSKSSSLSLYFITVRLILDVSTHVTKSSIGLDTMNAGSVMTSGPTRM